MRRFVVAALVVACAGLVGVARADDKANATGTWKWMFGRGDNQREATLKLKQDGDKLTGTASMGGGDEVKIEDGTYKDGEVSFKVTVERNGNKFVTEYKGKVSGDTLKGTAESERNGQKRSRPWEAKRAKD
jgi:hypothetical protein